MTLETIGTLLAIWGVVFGLGGAILTAQKPLKLRHHGFQLWLVNSPAVILSLVGMAFGWWSGLGALILVPLNTIYWYTAWVGFKNTAENAGAEDAYQGA